MATTKSDLIAAVTGYGYNLKSDSNPRGFDKQLFTHPSGVALTLTSNGAAHTIVGSSTNRFDGSNQTSSIGSLDTVANHLKAIYSK